MNELILSKESSESEIKAYFNAVLKLSKSYNEFPINLDEVWMLVYQRKDHAVRELVNGSQFIEGVDYQVFLKNGENQKGGRPTNEYKLTVSCMEFFIARKVRPVFEVYRQVFHKVAKRELSRKDLALMIIQSEEEKERLSLEKKQLEEKNAKLQPKAELADKIIATPDKVFKKNTILFAGLKNLCIFAVLKVGELIHFVGQSVNLLIYYMGYFYARTLKYWRLPIRKLRLAFRGKVHQLSAAYMATAFCLPII